MSELGFPTPLCGLYTSRPAPVSHVVRWIWMNGRDQGGGACGIAGPFSAAGPAVGFWASGEDHVWFEDRWMVASLCDE
jgi:hypothetical protein